MEFNTWTFENGITVKEVDCDYSLHSFEVYHEDRMLGDIVPASIDDMKECIKELDAGHDPITYGWEDGAGNSCDIEGWGIYKE